MYMEFGSLNRIDNIQIVLVYQQFHGWTVYVININLKCIYLKNNFMQLFIGKKYHISYYLKQI